MDKSEMQARLYTRLYRLAWEEGYNSQFAGYKTNMKLSFLIEVLILLRLWEGKGEDIYREAYEKGKQGIETQDNVWEVIP